MLDLCRRSMRFQGMPDDILLGMWLQPIEGLNYAAVYEHFHQHPEDRSRRAKLAERGGGCWSSLTAETGSSWCRVFCFKRHEHA